MACQNNSRQRTSAEAALIGGLPFAPVLALPVITHCRWASPIAAICFQVAGHRASPTRSAPTAAKPRHCRRGTSRASRIRGAGILYRSQQSAPAARACSSYEGRIIRICAPACDAARSRPLRKRRLGSRAQYASDYDRPRGQGFTRAICLALLEIIAALPHRVGHVSQAKNSHPGRASEPPFCRRASRSRAAGTKTDGIDTCLL
jgi:hypothetical protein